MVANSIKIILYSAQLAIFVFVHGSLSCRQGSLNILRPEQNGWHFTANIFKWTYLKERLCILIKILKFVTKALTDHKSSLAWRQAITQTNDDKDQWHNMASLGYNELTHWPLGNLNEIFRHVIFKQILVIDGWGISCEIALRWMWLNLTDDKSMLVWVMAWYH